MVLQEYDFLRNECKALIDKEHTLWERQKSLKKILIGIDNVCFTHVILPEDLIKKLENSIDVILSGGEKIESEIASTKLDDEFENIYFVCMSFLEIIKEMYSIQQINNVAIITMKELLDHTYDYIIVDRDDCCPLPLQNANNILAINQYIKFFWGISPERYDLLRKFELEKKDDIRRMVLGLSYTQRGINVERLFMKTVCMGAPSQDLFYDYHMCKYVCEQCTNMKFCIIGVSPYSLWYDMSLSEQTKFRSIYYYEQTKKLHNFEYAKFYEDSYKVMDDIYHKIFKKGYIEYLFEEYKKVDRTLEEKDLSIHNEENLEQIDVVVEGIKKLFNKPYRESYIENVKILDNLIGYLISKEIVPIVVIPSFSRLFRKYMSQDMVNQTLDVIYTLGNKYDFHFINCLEDSRFEDVYFSDPEHLNYFGANLMSDILNPIIEKL